MITRSNWGLTNRARFTGTSYTVYVEGGGGNAGQGSDDVLFWKAVFARLRPDLAITLKASGGKPYLEDIANRVASGAVANTIVAMDADFDELIEGKISSPRVFYTYGYSWENDATTIDTVSKTLERLIKVDKLPAHVITALETSFETSLLMLLKYVNADFYLRLIKSSLFPRLKTGHFIQSRPDTNEPAILLGPLKTCCVSSFKSIPKTNRARKPTVSIIDPQCYLQGHVIMFFVRKLLGYGVKISGRSLSLSEDLVLQTIIPAFADYGLTHNHLLRSHYTRMLNAV